MTKFTEEFLTFKHLVSLSKTENHLHQTKWFVAEAVTEGQGLLSSCETRKNIAFQTHFIDNFLPSVQCNARVEVLSTQE